MRLPYPSQHIFPPQSSRVFVSNTHIYYLRCPGANVQWGYSHSKCTFSSSLAISGISPIKGDEIGKSGFTAIHGLIKYIIVENFRLIGRGINNVLPQVPKFTPIHTPYSSK